MSLQSHVKSSICVPGITVEIASFAWQANCNFTTLNREHRFYRRSYPARLNAKSGITSANCAFGTLTYIPADVPVSVVGAEKSDVSHNIYCRIERSWFSEKVELPNELEITEVGACLDLSNSRISEALLWMGNESALPGFASDIVIESLASVIGIELSRHFRSKRPSRLRTVDGKICTSHLKWLLEYIDANSSRCPTVSELAALCDLSVPHLRRIFKNTTGYTIRSYVENIRFSKARELLAETDLPLKEISYRLGFAAPTAFSSAFKMLQRESPIQYRRRRRC